MAWRQLSQGMDEPARVPPNRLTDVIAGRERRLLVLGLERLVPPAAGKGLSAAEEAAKVAEELAGRPREERTAARLLSCIHLLQERLRVPRQQQRLLGLVYSFKAEPDAAQTAACRSGAEPASEHDQESFRQFPSYHDTDEEEGSEEWSDEETHVPARPGTAEILKDAALHNEFWKPFRSTCWVKRDVAPKAAGASLADFRPGHHRRPGLNAALPPVADSGSDARRTRRVLAGFSQSRGDVGETVPRNYLAARTKDKGAVMTLEKAVEMAKQVGDWSKAPTPKRSLSMANLQKAKTSGTLLPRLRSQASLEVRRMAHSYSASRFELASSRSSSTTGSRTATEESLSPLRVFPMLAQRTPMPTRVINFTDKEGDERQTVARYAEICPATGALDAPDRLLRPLDPEVAELVIERRPPTPQPPDEHPRDRHLPPWVVQMHAEGRLSPSSVYLGMGPKHFERVEAEYGGVKTTPQCVWLTTLADAKTLPRAPRAIVTAAAAAAKKQADGGGGNIRLDLGRLGLEDAALQALSASLRGLGPLEAFSIAGNKMSGHAVAAFVKTSLATQGSTLRELDLSWNGNLGSDTFDALTKLLQDGVLHRLEVLNISGVVVPEHCWEPLFTALQTSRLRALSAAETKLGCRRQQPAYDALAKLVGECKLTSLDISGNYLRREGCQALAVALAQTSTLQTLDVAHDFGDAMASLQPRRRRGASEDLNYASVMLLCEGLMRNRTLRALSLAGCDLDVAADFVLGQALLRHPVLQRLDVTSNPHGVGGLANLLRASGAASSLLRDIDVDGLRTNADSPQSSIDFRWSSPGGAYELDLRHPQHRAVLRVLLCWPTTCRKPTECFSEVSPGFSIEEMAKVDARGFASVPSEGYLRFKFTEPTPDASSLDQNDPLAKAQGHHLHGRTVLGLTRAAALVALLQSCGTDEQRQVCLEAVAEALVLKAGHVALLARAVPRALGSIVLQTLLPAIGHLRADTPLGVAGVRNKIAVYRQKEEVRLRIATASLVFFNMRNPTGRYDLNLSNPCDRACARRLQLLAAFEAEIQAALKLPDVSQRGNLEPVRNVRHEGYDLLRGQAQSRFATLALPTSGRLLLDYATRMRPPSPTPATSDQVVAALCATMCSIDRARLQWLEVLQAFRLVLDRLIFTAVSCRRIAESIRTIAGRDYYPCAMEALIACFARCCERSVLISPEVLHDGRLIGKEAAAIRDRLGCCHVLDWCRLGQEGTNLPRQRSFELDLAQNDERQVARFMLMLARKERTEEHNCLAECSWTAEELPKAWEEAWLTSGIPEDGILSGTYDVSEEAIQAVPRKDLAEKVLGCFT